jgi:uncharacterized membrane protein
MSSAGQRASALRRRVEGMRDSVRNGFWAIPALAVMVAVVLSVVLVRVDRELSRERAFTFGAGPEGAREVLGAITTAMITFTGLVFSITVVVLQLTSSQFSPRVLRTFLRDRLTQAALGVFVATFVYAVLVLRTISSGDVLFVPALSTTVALLLLLGSVAMFVAYIHHVATAIQATSIIGAIGRETRRALDRRFPGAGGVDTEDPAAQRPDGVVTAVVPAPRSGVITSVDEARLVDLASAADVVLRTRRRIGEFVPQGAPLLEVIGAGEVDARAAAEAVAQAQDRSVDLDVAFGFRQLVDIAERALSPGVNDPTTAVEALDQLHDLLRRLATRPLRSGTHVDDAGQVRLLLPAEDMGWFLSLALDEVEQYGAEASPVVARVRALLDDVTAAALPQHRDVLAARSAQSR